MIEEPSVRLRKAVIQGKLGVVRRILRHWPELQENIDSSNGWSSLHYAAFYGRYLICRLLTMQDADTGTENSAAALQPLHNPPLLQTYKGETSIHLAIQNGDEQTVHLLLQHFYWGLDVQSHCDPGWAPIHLACRLDRHRCLSLLLQCGADLQLRDSEGNTALHVAMEYGARQCLQVLLSSTAAYAAKTRPLAEAANKMGLLPAEVGDSDATIQFYNGLLKTTPTDVAFTEDVAFPPPHPAPAKDLNDYLTSAAISDRERADTQPRPEAETEPHPTPASATKLLNVAISRVRRATP